MDKEKIDEVARLRHKAHCISMRTEETLAEWSRVVEDIINYTPKYIGKELNKVLDEYIELDNDVSVSDFEGLKDEANAIIEDWLEIHNEKPSGIARANLKV